MAPLIEEYFEICRRNDESTFVIMQVGSFYEAYEDDKGVGCARRLSTQLNIHLTKKNSKNPVSRDNPYMCGFPVYTLQKHLTKLNDEGCRVVVYDQDDKNPKKRFQRGVYTPLLRYEFDDEETSSGNKKLYALMISPYRVSTQKRISETRYLISYIVLEVNTGKLVAFESDENEWKRPLDEFLLQYQPEQVLFCGSLNDDSLKSTLDNSTHSVLDSEPWVFQPILFHDSFQIPPEEDVIVHLSLDRHPHLLECLGRLLRFIRHHDASHVCALHKPQFIAPEEHMRWNHDAVRELNIFSVCEKRRSVLDKKKQKSVYDILSESMNSMGRRTLEKMLKHPLYNETTLKERYERIEIVSSVRDFSLPVLIDIEWYMLRWSKGKLSKRLLGILFQNYKTLHESVLPIWPDFFSENVTTQLKEFVCVIDTNIDIDKMIGQESRFFHDTRDELNADYLELESLQEQFSVFEQETGGKIMTDGDNHVIAMTPRAWKQQMKNTKWIVTSETKSLIRVTTQDLMSLSASVRTLEKKIHAQLQERFDIFSTELLHQYTPFLYQLNEEIAELSCLFPLARFFRDHHYVRPQCVSSSHAYVKVRQMRHAIMEYIHSDSLFVPLDVELGRTESPLGYLIYGMNSSGKSTMLKSLGLCTWLAHCGLYVPAQSMEFSPFDALYTKIGIQDNLFLGHSTFVAEMNELLYMMKRSTARTLVMCDELTSGTEAKSATGIVVASLLSFLEKKTCFLFTTHLHTVAQIPDIQSHPKIFICHFKITREKTPNPLLVHDIRLRYDRHLYKGAGEEEYGIEIATAVGLPKIFLDKAKHIRQQIEIQVNGTSKSKTSRYNRRFLLTECVVCSSKTRLHTHHITPQKEFKLQTHNHQKDGLYNLVALCESCHESLHHQHVSMSV